MTLFHILEQVVITTSHAFSFLANAVGSYPVEPFKALINPYLT